MAQTEKALLESLIEEFKSVDFGEGPISLLEDPKEADGMCWDISQSFATFLKGKGVRSYATPWIAKKHPKDTYFNMPIFPPRGWKEENGDPTHYWYPEGTPLNSGWTNHEVTVVFLSEETYMVDFTATQFGFKEFPLLKRLAGEDWEPYSL